MDKPTIIKQKLLDACVKKVEERIETLQQDLKSIQESRNNETKSSAGDKYETGRAMLQIEEDKYIKQLHLAQKSKILLLKLSQQKPTNTIVPGTLVSTNQANYFISIGIGVLVVDNQHFYCISPVAPIGEKLMGLKAGDEFEFQGNLVQILTLS